MAVLNLTPTRSNLLELKAKLVFAREGHDILEQKREVLTNVLLNTVDQAQEVESMVQNLMDKAYRALEIARLSMGQERVEWAALAVSHSIEVNIQNRGMMGVPLPHIEPINEIPKISYSLEDTSVALDESNDAFYKVLEQIPRLTELDTSVWRLARELKKTQRRVHALEEVFIPSYMETISYFENILEEQDREEIFQLKWLKKKRETMEKKKGLP